ncbi:MAG: phosphate acetyltransferase [Sulfurovum sp.]|nr:phosphate acetyltransferase [Sulfurovum sp.]
MGHQSIYLSSAQPRSGSLLVAIGIMEMLKGHFKQVAFFRPIVASEGKEDDSITFMRRHFQLKIEEEQCRGFSVDAFIDAYANNTENELIEAIIAKVSRLQESYDFVLIEGYPRERFSTRFDFDINLQIAKNLGTPYLPVLNAYRKNNKEIIDELRIISEVIAEEGCNHLATFINRCDPEQIDSLQKMVRTECQKKKTVFFLPNSDELDKPTLLEVATHLNAKRLTGNGMQLQRLVHGNKIAAMGMENYLAHIDDGDLVIVPGDRSEIILLSILAYHAKHHPSIAAIVLSGGISPSPAIMDLIEDLQTQTIPLLLVQKDSYHTAIALESLSPSLTLQNQRKITLAKALFDKAVNKAAFEQLFTHQASDIITPLMFQYRLIEQARSDKQHIILPESDDARILHAAEIIIRRGIADITLLGKEEAVMQRATQLGISLTGVRIVDPDDANMQAQFAQHFYTLRRHKGLTKKAAHEAMLHTNYFATMMVYEGMADAMVSGATHTTADTIRPALQIIKTAPGVTLVSSVFFMLLETRVLVYGDCAINLDPTAEELAQIAVSSAQTAQHFGIEPRVAMLSYSTGDSGSGPEVEKVRKATQLAQQLRPDLLIEGPMQYDAAIDEEVAKKKLPGSKVAGRATVFIFPDLNTGTNTYKAVQRSTGAIAIGPVLQGLRLPVNDLSRGCSVEDIVNTVAITAIQAQQVKRS